MAFAHGSNDAQKAMGIITLALATYAASRGTPMTDLHPPTWVILSCATAMALGTAAGGWRIMKTMGHRIIKLRPINGFAAETAAAVSILVATYLKAPVSTTHVIASSIMGVGAAKRVSAVRWGVARSMLIAWVLTLPVSAVIAATVMPHFGQRSDDDARCEALVGISAEAWLSKRQAGLTSSRAPEQAPRRIYRRTLLPQITLPGEEEPQDVHPVEVAGQAADGRGGGRLFE